MNIGVIGYGKIGKNLIKHLSKDGHNIKFILNSDGKDKYNEGFNFVKEIKDVDLENLDLVIECSIPEILKREGKKILSHTNLLLFSITTLSDENFYEEMLETGKENSTNIFIPHGAIVGLDGIRAGRDLIKELTIETIKPPSSFGRDDKERKVLFEGSTREACKLYPRNVNVHGAVALAGIGFDKTKSKMIADPSLSENNHIIKVKGDNFHFEIKTASFSGTGVTSAFVPISAVNSARKVLGSEDIIKFV